MTAMSSGASFYRSSARGISLPADRAAGGLRSDADTDQSRTKPGSGRSWRERSRRRASPSTSSRTATRARARARRHLRPRDPRPAAARSRAAWTALRRAARSATPSCPVLILSARSDLPTKLRGFELGAVDYVSKPFSLDELLARARVQLRRARVADEATVIRVGGLALDLARRQAFGRRHGRRSLRPRVPAAALPDAARRPGDQPRAAAVRGVGLRLRSTLERRRRLRPAPAPAARARRADRDRAECWLSRCCLNRRRVLPAIPGRAAVGGVRRRELRRDDRVAELGDDPVSLRLDQPDARRTGSASGRCGRR